MNVKEVIEVLSKLPGDSIVSVDDISNGGICSADLIMKCDGTILLTSSRNFNAATGIGDEEIKSDKNTLFYKTED